MIDHLDHLVLTTADEAGLRALLRRRSGHDARDLRRAARKAFRFGNQKINLHVKGREFEPKAHGPDARRAGPVLHRQPCRWTR